MARIVGIDLGTTNSLVAYMNGKTPTVIPGPEGRTLVPSVVAYTPSGCLVGDAAKEQLVRNPAHTVYSVKRFMGKGLSDVTQELRYRSEEHTSELQSRLHLVCRLLLEKKKKKS